jgi:hypothetical protein
MRGQSIVGLVFMPTVRCRFCGHWMVSLDIAIKLFWHKTRGQRGQSGQYRSFVAMPPIGRRDITGASMFRNTYQSGFISVFSARGSHPLQLWDVHLEDDGEIRMIEDIGEGDADCDASNHLCGPVIEMTCSNLSQNYIICPTKWGNSSLSSPERPSLGIALPFLYFTLYMPERTKQQQKLQMNHVSIEVTVLDDKLITRRFRCSTFQSTTSIQADICTFPLRLAQRPRELKREQLLLPPSAHDNPRHTTEQEDCQPCWNRICVHLAEYTKKAYGTQLLETKHIQIHGRRFQLNRVYFADKQVSEDELPHELRLCK